MEKRLSRSEQRALEAYPTLEQAVFDEMYPRLLFTRNTERSAFVKGYEQAEKDLIPLINRLCEAILFDWDNKAELAWEIQSKIKEEKK